MTQILGSDSQSLIFEVVSARICEDASQDKKHVIYTLQVRFISGNDDPSPSVIERRYTHFLNLYSDLKKEVPSLMSNVDFPKKVLIGNFDNELISNRSTGFESLLRHISMHSKLRTSKALLNFLQSIEMEKISTLLSEANYSLAYTYLENNFRLLNKVFTDRSPPVLLCLCRLVDCAMKMCDIQNAMKWGDLALHRYDGVSDSYLLELYAPLVHLCSKIWQLGGRSNNLLEQKLLDLRRQGLKLPENMDLIKEVDSLEKKMMSESS